MILRSRLISALCLVPPSLAFVVPRQLFLAGTITRHSVRQRQHGVTRLFLSDSPNQGNNATDFTSNNKPSDLQRQQQEAQDLLQKIGALKNAISYESSSPSTLKEYDLQVGLLEAELKQMEKEWIPPVGLSMDDYQAAVAAFLLLPFTTRWAFCLALELDRPDKAACDLTRISEIVTVLYQNRIQLTPQRLIDAKKKVEKTIQESPAILGTASLLDAGEFTVTTSTGEITLKEIDSEAKNENTSNDPFFGANGWLSEDGKSEEQLRLENTVKNFLGRVTRKEDHPITKQDLDQLIKVLNKDIYVVSETQPILGGYVIRGRNAKKTGSELIEAIDNKLPAEYPGQVHWMVDITSADAIGSEDNDPMLVLLNKDFTPQNQLLGALTTSLGILSAFIFCISVYGANDLVSARLADATAVNDADGLSWFTQRIYDVLLPMLAIQAVHEGGHFVMAKRHNMDMGIPTLIPFYGLPFMGTKTDLITSPPTRNALFDFGIIGPLFGLLASLGCLGYGLELTATADAATSQFFPALPVSILQSSSLGGSFVDFFLGGGFGGAETRFITMQDPSTPIPLHPLAIAGFTSLLANAIALLPLGATDGGRMSLALLGRYGHSFMGALTWFVLLVASFTLERPDVLVGAWAINNFIQNDMEIPCREELEEVTIPRAVAALGLWFLAVLALVPLS